MKKQAVIRLVEEPTIISPQVIEIALTASQVAHRDTPAVLPMLVSVSIA
jgi:hypothetical protein